VSGDKVQVESSRRHPDLFTPEEAAAYLHLDSVRGLETLRRDYGLTGYEGVNKSYLYHREDLDSVAMRIVGRDPTWKGTKAAMRIAR
jgi:hypothetical protein